jgi:hypothetical protein
MLYKIAESEQMTQFDWSRKSVWNKIQSSPPPSPPVHVKEKFPRLGEKEIWDKIGCL